MNPTQEQGLKAELERIDFDIKKYGDHVKRLKRARRKLAGALEQLQMDLTTEN